MYTLTVDDRELVVTLMLGILRNLDPDGTHLGATDPQKALRLAKESPLDVAFLDVEMPGEINGLDLGKRLRQCYPKLNIVIITGHSEYAVDAFGLDASGYLLKPLTQEAVAHQLSVLRFAPRLKRNRAPISGSAVSVPLRFSATVHLWIFPIPKARNCWLFLSTDTVQSVPTIPSLAACGLMNRPTSRPKPGCGNM